MATAPKVRELSSLITTLGKAVDPQKALLDKSITDNATAGAAQIAGLGAVKDTVFNTEIPQAAQDKGMLFSGFTPDEQAKYTAGTYLPKLAELQATIAQTRAGLLGKKADLDTDVYNKAFDTQQQDRSVLADWNKMTAEQKFTSTQAQKDRVFKAQQAEKERAFTASQNAAARAAQASAAARSAAKTPSAAANAAAGLRAYVGDDGYVSPGTWGSVKAQWVSSGDGNAKEFDKLFGGFKNPKNKAYR